LLFKPPLLKPPQTNNKETNSYLMMLMISVESLTTNIKPLLQEEDKKPSLSKNSKDLLKEDSMKLQEFEDID